MKGMMRFARIIAGFICLSLPAHADPRIWKDPVTGYAIGGFDVVSYWSASGPTMGFEEYEVFVDGVSWRFANQGNRDEFLKHLSIYRPQYSGYGAYAVAHGKVPRGNPITWVIYEQKLYFFYSIKAKKSWERNKVKMVRQADKNWVDVQKQIERITS